MSNLGPSDDKFGTFRGVEVPFLVALMIICKAKSFGNPVINSQLNINLDRLMTCLLTCLFVYQNNYELQNFPFQNDNTCA